MKLYYPPVGIAHIITTISDLFYDRLSDSSSIQIACISQPKTAPHFGTMIVIFSAFALAQKLKIDFNLKTDVLVDSLENSPARTIEIDGTNYSLCLSHEIIGRQNLAEINLKPIIEIAKWASNKTKIDFSIRPYKKIQSQIEFRNGLRKILTNPDLFLPMLSPSEKKLRIRPICPHCGLVDKEAKTVKYDNFNYPNLISFVCPNHGIINAYIDNTDDVIDCNTPIRTILRSIGFIAEKNITGKETIIINGSDWSGAWMQRVYFDSLSTLGFNGRQIPFNIFTPQITDWSGAKLSKTIYLDKNAYADIDKAWISVPDFIDKFGDKGLDIIWGEVSSWFESPKKLFRNYSLDYIRHLFDETRIDSNNL